jgi:glycosyltransferase involved in cell wall biosynthesis
VPDVNIAEDDLKKYCETVTIIPHPLSSHKLIGLLMKSFLTKVPLSTYIYRSESMVHAIERITSKNHIDVIHADTLGMIEPLFHKLTQKKVLTHHDIESHKMSRRIKNEKNILKQIVFKHEYNCIYEYENKYCKKFDLNLTVSEVDCERLREIHGDINTEVIENGVDCDYFKYYPGNYNSKELIFMGALDYYPNTNAMQYFCSDIWPLLKKKHPEVSFTIIGKNPSSQLLTIVNAHEDIRIVGFVDDVRPYLREASIFVCPIMEGGGTRIKILDAFAQGIPVISTDVGAEGLNVKNGKQIILANSITEFVDGISTLMEREELFEAISLNARKFVEDCYSYGHIGRKMATLFETLF